MNASLIQFNPRGYAWILLLLSSSAAMGAEPAGPAAIAERSVAGSLGMTVLFALVGVVVAVVGYRIFDLFTPGDLHKEILENKNLAAAMVAAAVILGVCLIVAASIAG